jgi:hypothetical protein
MGWYHPHMTIEQIASVVFIGTGALCFAGSALFRRKYHHNGKYNMSPGAYVLRSAGEKTLPYYQQLEKYGENDDIMTLVAEAFIERFGTEGKMDAEFTNPIMTPLLLDAHKYVGTNTREMIVLGLMVGIDGESLRNADMSRVFTMLHKGRPTSEINLVVANDIDEGILDSFRNGDSLGLRPKS